MKIICLVCYSLVVCVAFAPDCGGVFQTDELTSDVNNIRSHKGPTQGNHGILNCTARTLSFRNILPETAKPFHCQMYFENVTFLHVPVLCHRIQQQKKKSEEKWNTEHIFFVYLFSSNPTCNSLCTDRTHIMTNNKYAWKSRFTDKLSVPSYHEECNSLNNFFVVGICWILYFIWKRGYAWHCISIFNFNDSVQHQLEFVSFFSHRKISIRQLNIRWQELIRYQTIYSLTTRI